MARPIRSAIRSLLQKIGPDDHLRHLDQDMIWLIKRIRSARLTYLSEKKLSGLLKACVAAERNGVAGSFVEAGCALGGSAILMATYKATSRPLKVHDVFGLIPPPGPNDPPEVHERYMEITSGHSAGIAGDPYYGYQGDLLETVIANMADFAVFPADHNVSLIRGLVADTIVGDEPVALAHIDVDWHDPVDTCLRRIFPRLPLNGMIILDDYQDWGGCRMATDAFLKEVEGQFSLDNSFDSLAITRIAS